MVKTITFIKRKPGMNLDEFGQYWRTKHAPIVTKLPGLRRYIQCHTIPSGYRNGEPAFDGVAEVWFDSTEAMRETAKTAEYRAVRADEPNFLDMSKMDFVITEERVQKDATADPSMVHLVEFVKRKAGMEVEAFQCHWREIHGPLGAKIPQVRRYVQCHVRPAAYRDGRQPPYDGVAEVWFDSTAAMRESATTPEYRAVRADEPNFIDTTRPFPFIITRDFAVL
jgi:uncharacterized protein (TIGR02118 family)